MIGRRERRVIAPPFSFFFFSPPFSLLPSLAGLDGRPADAESAEENRTPPFFFSPPPSPIRTGRGRKARQGARERERKGEQKECFSFFFPLFFPFPLPLAGRGKCAHRVIGVSFPFPSFLLAANNTLKARKNTGNTNPFLFFLPFPFSCPSAIAVVQCPRQIQGEASKSREEKERRFFLLPLSFLFFFFPPIPGR